MRRVHVLGNAGTDIILNVARAPADGETLIAERGARAPGGKGLNQAVVAARAGAEVRFEAPIGRDAEADFVRLRLAREPIREAVLRTVPFATDLSVVIVDAVGGNRIVSTSDCADSVTPDDALRFADGLAAGDLFLMQGNLSRAATEAAARRAGSRGAETVLNLAPCRWAPSAAMPKVTLVVNRLEAEGASGCADPEGAARALCRAGARRAIVTLGAEGCVLAEGDGIRRFPAERVPVVDTTGAGDTFCGMLAAALAFGDAIETAIRAAQRAAAIAITRPGAFDALPTASELATARSPFLPDATAHPAGR